jgi:hypothetical protein
MHATIYVTCMYPSQFFARTPSDLDYLLLGTQGE